MKLKKSTKVLGFGKIRVGDSIEFNIVMNDEKVYRMMIEVKISEIEDDDTIHFREGSGTIEIETVARVRATILDAVGEEE